ncbi:MAG TPA: hypothetical protein DHW61_07360 [Lachnoclostridium phytofermentans]|uniref:DUF1700 domain-containing protein n=1 Tax=Lachnoclostridium phytofermentans TaxID=66219 RepID=A0A3D2X674_9FIRM|nr:DUF1700 domain-containing protein [Lachnoclostridium sp.]HCL02217.1 hypothetical protein [Lachnoclostridium phytofermentans]
MTIQEFLNQLRDSLDGELPYNEIVSNINYYRDYMNSKKGEQSEEEITAGIGDPRLIARTIIDTYKMNHDNKVHYQSYSYSDGGNYQSANSSNANYDRESDRKKDPNHSVFKTIGMKGWLGCLISLFILFIVLGAVFWIGAIAFKVFFKFVLPVILIVAGISYLSNRFKRR